MIRKRIFAYISVLLLLSSVAVARAQAPADSIRSAEKVKGIQYATAKPDTTWRDPLFGGVNVGVDLCGAVMASFGAWGQYEGQLRANFLNTWFPVVEVGVGVSDHDGEETELHYRTHSPYFCLGCDYNVLKEHQSGNRLFVGLRYAFSPFKYDVAGPAFNDPVYGGELPFRYSGLKSTAHWAEAVLGVDVKVWRFVRLGWSFRYKFMFKEKETVVGKSWYVPGYGKSGGKMLGGSFNLSFDI